MGANVYRYNYNIHIRITRYSLSEIAIKLLSILQEIAACGSLSGTFSLP